MWLSYCNRFQIVGKPIKTSISFLSWKFVMKYCDMLVRAIALSIFSISSPLYSLFLALSFSSWHYCLLFFFHFLSLSLFLFFLLALLSFLFLSFSLSVSLSLSLSLSSFSSPAAVVSPSSPHTPSGSTGADSSEMNLTLMIDGLFSHTAPTPGRELYFQRPVHSYASHGLFVCSWKGFQRQSL